MTLGDSLPRLLRRGLAASWSSLAAPVAANSPESSICHNNAEHLEDHSGFGRTLRLSHLRSPPPPFFLVGGLHILYEGVKRERSTILK